MAYAYIYIKIYMGVSINGGTPIAGWFIRDNPTKMDDDWGYPHDYGNPLIDLYIYIHIYIWILGHAMTGPSLRHSRI